MKNIETKIENILGIKGISQQNLKKIGQQNVELLIKKLEDLTHRATNETLVHHFISVDEKKLLVNSLKQKIITPRSKLLTIIKKELGQDYKPTFPNLQRQYNAFNSLKQFEDVLLVVDRKVIVCKYIYGDSFLEYPNFFQSAAVVLKRTETNPYIRFSMLDSQIISFQDFQWFREKNDEQFMSLWMQNGGNIETLKYIEKQEGKKLKDFIQKNQKKYFQFLYDILNKAISHEGGKYVNVRAHKSLIKDIESYLS